MSERTDNETSSDVSFATIGARYAMPGLAAVEAKAREIIEGDVVSKSPRPASKVAPDASTESSANASKSSAAEQPRADEAKSARTPAEDASAVSGKSVQKAPPPGLEEAKLPNARASSRKPTPPPFAPIAVEETASRSENGNGQADPELVAQRARLKRKNGGTEKLAPAAKPPKPNQKLKQKPELAVDPPEPGSTWHEEIFDDSWTSLEPRSAGYHAREDVRFLLKYCEVPRKGKILDVACGVGRHAMEMASAGYHVVGIDRSRGYLTKAVEEANRSDLKIKFVEGDMRAFSLPPSFDAVTSLHTSFGYFSDRENEKALRCMAASVVPGGQLILDVVNRDWVASIGARRLWWEHRGFLVMEDVIFRHATGHLEVERTVVGEDSPRWDQKFQVRLYTVAEYVQMFRTLGLELIDVTGNLAHPGVYLGASNHRMILRARKPAE